MVVLKIPEHRREVMADYDLLLLDTKAEIIRFNDAPAIVFQILC